MTGKEIWSKTTSQEKRNFERVSALFCSGKIAGYEDNLGEKLMKINNIKIKDISLGGISFMLGSKSAQSCKIHEIYELTIKSDTPWKEPELKIKIAIIRTSESAGYTVYSAVYRNLTDVQLTELKKIIAYQKGMNEAIANAPVRSH